LLKQISAEFLLWIVYVPGYSQGGLFQGCGAVVKMTQLWLRS